MNKINKLQLRAEVIKQINNLKINDLYATNGDNALELIKSLDDKENTLDILLKELKNSDGDRTQIIAYLVLELSRLEDIQDTLWDYIKDFNVSDYIKEVSCSILRAQGGSITIEELSEYLSNPEEIIDAETKKLLEESFENPEALIDFLDFLFALNEEEQILLLESLKDDYPQNYVANILIPAINSNPSYKIKETIIEMLGNTKSEIAVKPLNDILSFSKDVSLEKKAKKSLNLLKLSGIDIKKAKKTSQKTLCTQDTKPFKAYSTNIDGAGNQGFIIGRIRDDNSIQMFSTVINDIDGIIDCFGFNQISNAEFKRIVKRLETKNAKIEPSFNYVKYRLEEAQQINKKKNYPIPYEFVAWKELLADIDTLKETPSKLVEKWGDDLLYPDFSLLKQDDIFESWFLEEEDNKELEKSLKDIKSNLNENIKAYIDNLPEFLKYIDKIIEENLTSIFNKTQIKQYINRLENTAYILNSQDKVNIRNITSSLVVELKKNNDISNIDFFKDILKKSIYENLLREKELITETDKVKTIFEDNSQKSEYDFKEEELNIIIENIFKEWSN